MSRSGPPCNELSETICRTLSEDSLSDGVPSTLDRDLAPADSSIATLHKILDSFDLLIGPAASLDECTDLISDARTADIQLEQLAMAEMRLALGYRGLFDYSANIADLQSCIQLLRDALQMIPEGCRGEALTVLVGALSECVNETEDESLLDEAISCQHQLTNLIPLGRPAWSNELRNLATLLQAKFDISGQLIHINEAIDLHRNLLDQPTSDRSLRDVDLANLAALYFNRSSDDRGFLEEAVKLYREALELCPPGHTRHAQSLGHLASSLADVYNLTSEDHYFEEAASLFPKVLEDISTENSALSIALTDFGVCLYNRARWTGDIRALENALERHRDALQLRPHGHSARAISLSYLGKTLQALFERTGNELSLMEAMAMYEEALGLFSTEHPDYLEALGDIAKGSIALYRLHGNVELLDEAVVHLRQVVDCLPESHAQCDIYLNNLACTLQIRFEDFGQVEDLNEAIKFHREALTLVSAAGHACPDSTMGNLALALHLQYKLTGSRASLDGIVHLFREALATHPPGHPKRAIALNNLGATLLDVAEDTRDPSLLEEAVVHLQDAMSLTPPEHPGRAACLGNLASAFAARFTRTHDIASLDDAIQTTMQALILMHESNLHLVLMNYQLSYYHLEGHSLSSAVDSLSHAVFDLHTSPRIHLIQALNALRNIEVAIGSWGGGQVSKDLHHALLSIYERVLQLLPRAAYFSLDLPTRMRELANSEGLGVMASAYALSLGHLETAVEQLESGRATFWTQALNLRTRDFDGLPTEIVEELTSLFRQLEQGSYSNPRLTRPEASPMIDTERVMIARRRSGERAEEIIQGIRRRPGFERFLLGQHFAHLARVAEKGPVVVLLAHTGACEAIIIKDAAGTAVRVPLSDLKYDDLEKMTNILNSNNLNMRSTGVLAEEVEPSRGYGIRRAASSKAWAFLNELWRCVVRPIIDALALKPSEGRTRPRIHWCPTGLFAFIPIHAAGLYTHPVCCCSDYMVSSYTPTLGALLKARRELQPLRLSCAKALLVSEPAAPGLPRLTSAQEESTIVTDTLRSVNVATSLVGSGVPRSDDGARMHAVIDNLPEVNILHLACHGLQSMSNALESGFFLRDGTLTVAKLMELDLQHAFFAYLSACETAKGDMSQPDQTVHLAAAMLFVGFRSVIGTMWTIDDSLSLIIARKVYERLVEYDLLDSEAIPHALDTAIREVRRQQYSPNQWAPFIHIGA